MEFIIETKLESLPKSIEFNNEQLKSELSEKLEYYKNIVVTEDSIKPAKEDRATLNKLRTALESKRKEVKKECLKPYEDFERQVKELVAMIDEPIELIDTQLKTFDEEKKAKKQKSIEVFYTANVGKLRDILPLEKIFNQRWLNATFDFMKVSAEMMEIFEKTENDIKIIKAMKLDCETQVLDAYLKNLDMSEALAEKNRFEEQQAKIKEYEEAQKAKEREQQEVIEVAKIEIEQEQEIEPQEIQPVVELQEETKTIKVIFHDTTEAFRAEMKALTIKHNIKYGGIK